MNSYTQLIKQILSKRKDDRNLCKVMQEHRQCQVSVGQAPVSMGQAPTHFRHMINYLNFFEDKCAKT
jgi:hypothetical protein